MTEDRRTPEATADQNTKGDFACRIAHGMHADVMKQRAGPVLNCTVHRDLEFTRQIGKLGMKS